MAILSLEGAVQTDNVGHFHKSTAKLLQAGYLRIVIDCT